MPDLKDGESVEMKGSGSQPYVLKNVGGVYSCTCPAWRNQSLAIERRTCKHLRKLRGDAAEEERVGNALPAPARPSGERPEGPPLLLAETWDGTTDHTGWLMSEKLDGVRAYWTGDRFLSRLGNVYHAPEWFTAGLPDVPLDGELWLGRKQFSRTVSIVRRQDKTDLWQEVRYLVFDAPAVDSPFEERIEVIDELLRERRPKYAAPHAHAVCRGLAHLREELARIEQLGGEGVMLREPASKYEIGRSQTLLKVKNFHDAEARVIGHEPGRGRHKGRLGALLVELPEGTQFSVGTGLSDAERERPPALGTFINFRYQELSDAGVPRFPTYVGVRDERPAAVPQLPQESSHPKETTNMSTPASTGKRRFEFVEGSSDKFWEISMAGTTVTVRYGRNGTDGQTNEKSFANAEAAAKHAEKLIREKTGKGYVEVG